MPYFFILPVWLAAFVVMAGVTLTTRLVRRFAPVYPFAWRVLLWSSIGTWAANALAFACWFVAAQVFEAAQPPPIASPAGQVARTVAVVGVLFVGPFVVSAAGFAGGTALGASLAFRARRRRSRRSEAPFVPEMPS